MLYRAMTDVDEVLPAGVVVIGSGVAGMTTALQLAPRRVTLLTPEKLGLGGSSPWAQGGVAAAMAADDSPAEHAADTLSAGAGLCDPRAVAGLTAEAAALMRWLIELGARFDRDDSGALSLGREGAHGRRRILHASGDATGAELVRALRGALEGSAHLRTVEGSRAEELVLDEGRVVGVATRLAAGRRVVFAAEAVVLAAGGFGQLFLHTTNPRGAVGDGLAMAARAGAELADLEMVQFHPTALLTAQDPLPLVTEALRGEGAVLIDGRGERFMPAIHQLAELAPRDIVARAIWRRREAGDQVFLDSRRVVGDRFPRRFPTVFEHCRQAGIDPRRQPIPVTPAAHYAMAGVAVDALGRTSLPGLWACGEVTSSGVHGANRLASNSLVEGVVWGARVARDLAATTAPQRLLRRARRGSVCRDLQVGRVAEEPRLAPTLRRLMWRHVGLVRDASGLRWARERIEQLAQHLASPLGPTASLLTNARLVTQAACERCESRGSHYRSDFPHADPAWCRRLHWTWQQESQSDAWQLSPVVAHQAQREIA